MTTRLVTAFFCLLMLLTFVAGLSTIPPVENGGTVILARRENETNVSIFCRVTVNGSAFQTTWFLTRLNQVKEVITFFPATPNFIAVGATSNLTIESFSRDLDKAILRCSNDAPSEFLENAMFLLRIIEPPVLKRESTAMTAAENSMYAFNIEQSAGFPLVPSYQWFYDGELINTDTSINPNVSNYSQIVFNPLLRTHSGNYSMIATTEAGNSTGYFILDVQYGVEAVAGTNDQFCVLEGGNVTLVAFTSITGNPVPQSSWELIGGTLGGDTTSRELTITNAASSGNYTNTLSNTVSGTINQMNRTVELRVLSLPTAPRNLAVINLTDDSSTTIIFSWQNPSTSGVPPFSTFLVELVSMSPSFTNVNRTFNAISTGLSFNNTFTVIGLKPITNYTVSVRAVSPQLDMSCMEQGVAYSQPSDTVSFMTMAGDPEFASTNLVNTNGKLVVTWSFKHTGGAPLTSVVVTCRSEEEEGSGSGLASDMSCGTDMCDGMAVIPTGPENVTAGMNYSCTVTATNELGNKEQQSTNYILATSGVPSVPMITGITVGIRLFTVTVTVFAGHTSLYFNVSVMNEQTGAVTVLSDTQTGVPSGLMSYMIAVNFTQSGRHRFTVSASNPFGRSAAESDMYPPMGMDGLEVIMPSSTPAVPAATSSSPTSTPTTPPPPPPESDGLSTGVVVGIVVVLIALILIVVVVVLIVGFILYKNKGDTYKVENKKGVMVEEHDIDIGTELQPSASDSLPPAEPAPSEPVAVYSAVGADNSEPRAELHYADLQDFKKVDRSNRSVTKKSAPIEEVQYAVINPKSLVQKPPEPAKEDGGEAAGDEAEKAQTSTTFI